MATTIVVRRPMPLHPLHSIFLAFPLPLFVAALLSDLAYASSFQVQWVNFAQWLLAGGLLIGAFAVVWAVVGVVRSDPPSKGRHVAYLVSLLAMWVLGLVDSFIHAKDAFASMPTGIYLSAVVALLALIAAWIGYSGFQSVEVR